MRNIVSHFILTFALLLSLSSVLACFYSITDSSQYLKFMAEKTLALILNAVWDGITCVEYVDPPSQLAIRVILPVRVRGCFLEVDELGYLSILFGGFQFSIKLPSRLDVIYLSSKVYLSGNEVLVLFRCDGEYIYVKLSSP